VHLLVTAGALTEDRTAWIRPAHPNFPLPGFDSKPHASSISKTAANAAKGLSRGSTQKHGEPKFANQPGIGSPVGSSDLHQPLVD
jgi:hypothetical protein